MGAGFANVPPRFRTHSLRYARSLIRKLVTFSLNPRPLPLSFSLFLFFLSISFSLLPFFLSVYLSLCKFPSVLFLYCRPLILFAATVAGITRASSSSSHSKRHNLNSLRHKLFQRTGDGRPRSLKSDAKGSEKFAILILWRQNAASIPHPRAILIKRLTST